MSIKPEPASRKIPRNVVILGWVSLLNDMASEMLYPVIPLFLTATLGSSPALLGLIDGVADGISSALRWLGGALSDRFGRRKPFVAIGYALSAISKPVMGFAAVALGWPMFLAGRCADRLGKSIRTSARDALIADSTAPEYRGAAFGFHRAMDTCGAIIGPLMTLGIVALIVGWGPTFHAGWGGKGEHGATLKSLPLAWLFYAALVPGLLCVWLVIRSVRDIPPRAGADGKPPAIWQKFPAPFWGLILANFVFSLGNSSDSFLILRSTEVGLSFGHVVLAYTVYNCIYAAASHPLGQLSDKIGRKPVVIAGWFVYAAVYLGFAATRSALLPWILFATYGLYQALTDGVTKAMVSDIVPPAQRAGAIGLFYTASGIGQLAASVVAGVVWNVRVVHGQVMIAFLLGTVCALIAIPILATVRAERLD